MAEREDLRSAGLPDVSPNGDIEPRGFSFLVIGHNAATTPKSLRRWRGTNVTHLEVDVRQTRNGWKAKHAWLSIGGVPLLMMVDEVKDLGKCLYVDFKYGQTEKLLELLDSRGMLTASTFLVYSREKAMEVAAHCPNQVFIHPKSLGAYRSMLQQGLSHGICLPGKFFSQQAADSARTLGVRYLATFANSVSHGMEALSLGAAGITTDFPEIANRIFEHTNS